MRIGPTVIDTENMTVEEVEILYQQIRTIYIRKKNARSCKCNLKDVIKRARDDGYVFCSNTTGEVFNPDDWDVYDEKMECIHSKEID